MQTINTTLNQVNDIFKDFASRHLQIHGYYFGDELELDKIESFHYPLLASIPVDSRLVKGSMIYRFSIICADIISEDRTNEVEVLSDTLQILTDFISEVNNNHNYNDNDIQILTDSTFVPFYDKFNDIVSGWVLNIQVNVLYKNACLIPVSDKTDVTLNGTCN